MLRLLYTLIQSLLPASYRSSKSSFVGLFGWVLCSCFPLVAQLDCFDYGPFYFLCCGFRSAPVFRKQTSFDSDFFVYEMLIWGVVLSRFFRRVLLRLSTGEPPRVVLILHWDARRLRVLPMLLGFCHTGNCSSWLHTFLQLLVLISSFVFGHI
jgi:hypothetical protein